MNDGKKLQKMVRQFMSERDWLNQPAADVSKSIVIEAAELLEHFQWNSFFAEDVLKDKGLRSEVVDELADVFIYAIEMSIILDCSIEEIVHAKLAKAAKKYPPTVIHGRIDSNKYRQIKREFRHRG